ncbi:hypothetical protein FACS1894184_15530 [Clostridia bacterium]|nr:hypothetical protein FACS1894184_15530 [Clostridia bacterium]
MRRFVIFLVVLALLVTTCGAALAEETPPLYRVGWAHTLGGDGDELLDISVASDGSIWLAGYAVSDSNGPDGANVSDDALGGEDGWVTLMDSAGNTLWSKRYGGSGDDRLHQIQPLSDGGAVILGETTSSDGQVKNQRGSKDAWVIRVDAEGELVWQKCLGGTLDDGLTAMRLSSNVLTESGGTEDRIILAGWSKSYNNDLERNDGGKDAWACAIRLEDGRSSWQYSMGEAGDDWFSILLSDRLGVMAIGGATRVDAQGVQQAAPLMVIIGNDGSEVSVTRLQLKGDAWINDAVVANDGWLLAGRMGTQNSDAWLGHVTSDGSFNATYLEGNTNGQLTIIRQYTFNITLAVGTLDSQSSSLTGVHGGRDAWAVGLTRDRVQWEQALGGSGVTTPLNIQRRSDGRYMIALSTTSSDGDLRSREEKGAAWMVLLDANGNLTRHNVLAPYADQRFTEAVATPDSGLAFVGRALDVDGQWRAAIMKAVQ